MKEYPIESIVAPAWLFVGGNVIVMNNNIKVQRVHTKNDVAVSHGINAGEITTGDSIVIKGTPTAFLNSSALFDVLALVPGQRLPKIEDVKIVARTAAGEWVQWEFLPAIHSGVGGINFGANSPVGENQWDIYPDPLNPTTPMVSASTLSTPPTFPTLTSSQIFMLRCLAVYGAGESLIDFDTDGASIDIALALEDDENDRLLKFGKILTDVNVTAKLKPRNITYADWLELTKIAQSKAIGSFTPSGSNPDLVLRGAAAGSPMFTLKSAKPKDPSATFGAKDKLMDELNFEVEGDAVGENKLAISTAAADFVFDAEE